VTGVFDLSSPVLEDDDDSLASWTSLDREATEETTFTLDHKPRASKYACITMRYSSKSSFRSGNFGMTFSPLENAVSEDVDMIVGVMMFDNESSKPVNVSKGQLLQRRQFNKMRV
jgi:hypothetical protein